jgi:hypothetical protein
VISGRSELDEGLITGETTHKQVAAGAAVYAGSINYSGALTMRVSAAGAGTLIDEVERFRKGGGCSLALPAARGSRGTALRTHGPCHRRDHGDWLARRRRLLA